MSIIIFWIFIILAISNLLYFKYKNKGSAELYNFTIDKQGKIDLSKLLTYKDFKKDYTTIHLDKYIPKIVFRTSHFKSDKDAPIELKKILGELISKNPEYKQIYFDDDDCYNFIKEIFPQYLNDYNSLIPTAYKSDLWRLLVLYYYGGIYNDIGHQYLVSIKDVISDDDELVLVWDYNKTYAIHNAFIAVYPRHPYIKLCIDKIINNIRNRSYGTSSLDITSCQPMGRIFNLFFNRRQESKLYKGVFKNKNEDKAKLYYLKLTNDFFIEGIDNKPLIKTKFNNYYKIMYKNRKMLHYNDLWYMRHVYK